MWQAQEDAKSELEEMRAKLAEAQAKASQGKRKRAGRKKPRCERNRKRGKGSLLFAFFFSTVEHFHSYFLTLSNCHFQFLFCIQLVGAAIAPSGKVEGSDADR